MVGNEKVELICEDSEYVIKYKDNGSSFITCYPYKPENQEKVLREAREFGEGIAKTLNLPLEETLNKPN